MLLYPMTFGECALCLKDPQPLSPAHPFYTSVRSGTPWLLQSSRLLPSKPLAVEPGAPTPIHHMADGSADRHLSFSSCNLMVENAFLAGHSASFLSVLMRVESRQACSSHSSFISFVSALESVSCSERAGYFLKTHSQWRASVGRWGGCLIPLCGSSLPSV